MKNKKNLIVFLGIFIILLVIVSLYVFYNLLKDKKVTNCEVELSGPKEVEKQRTFLVNSIETGVKIGNRTYAKINVELENKADKDFNMNLYLYQIADKDKNVIAMCHTAATDTTNKSDILASVLPANGKITGNLYCETDRKDLHTLKISYISGGHYHSDGTIEADEIVTSIDISTLVS